MEKYLVYLDAVMCALLGLSSWALRRRTGESKDGQDGFWILCLVPGVMFLVVMISRQLMGSVDVGELERMKYRYKGA